MEEYSIVISNCVGRKKCLLYTGAVYCYREKNETHLGGAAVSRLAKLVNAVKESNLGRPSPHGGGEHPLCHPFPGPGGDGADFEVGRGRVFHRFPLYRERDQRHGPAGLPGRGARGSYPTPGTIRDFVAQRGIRTLGYENCTMTVKDYHTYRAVLPASSCPLTTGWRRCARSRRMRDRLDCGGPAHR